MIKNLVVIESPNKEKTIGKYLGKDFKIIATVGHIRDIPTSGKNVYDPVTYEPNFKISYDKKTKKSKKEIIEKIKELASQAEKIYLATDPDREGEAIAWHVYEVLPKEAQQKCTRITFNEITKDAIENAIKNERQIDLNWVHSQFARRILDRIVGYDLSRLVRDKFNGSSAGRVQSVALKFIYEREQEILKFKPITTYTLDVTLDNNDRIYLRKTSSKSRDEKEDSSILEFKTEKEAQEIKNNLGKYFEVYYPKGKEDIKVLRRNPEDPFKTSTLQQTAINHFGWTISRITKIIQDLYEGIDINGEHVALITYPRTDSIRMSDSFKTAAKKFIKNVYGEEYVNQGVKLNKTPIKTENVQDAHECIRVIDPFLTPSKLKGKISDEYTKMYELIWRRSIACLMTPCRIIHKTVRFINGTNKFFTYSNTIEFDGYKKVYNQERIYKEGSKNTYKEGQKYTAKLVEITSHTTQPPARYNQASLVKALDDAGVGRPSTYKQMVDVNPERGYCESKNKAFYMTQIGNSVIKGLIKNFDDIIDKDFTKQMEERLDAIADKKEPWNEWLKVFIPQFQKKVSTKSKNIEAKELLVGRKCPVCGKPLVYRFSKVTKKQFIGCSDYPNCKYAEFPNVKELDVKCPICGHNLVQRTSKKGRTFIGCSNYPNCTFMASNIEEAKNYDPSKATNKEEK